MTSQKNIDLAETLVPKGAYISEKAERSMSSGEPHVFLLFGGNVIALPKLQPVTGDSSCFDEGVIDVAELAKIVYSRNLWKFADLLDAYFSAVGDADGRAARTKNSEDTIMGILIYSQMAVPLASLIEYTAAWSSYSLIPTRRDADTMFSGQATTTAEQLFMGLYAAPNLSVWDQYDGLVSGHDSITPQENENLIAEIKRIIRWAVENDYVYINVPSSEYNQ